MSNPAELSRQFLEAYNQRDADQMRAMLAPEVVYIRPGPTRIEGVDEIMARYARDWERYDTENVVRHVLESGDTAVMEMTIVFPTDSGVDEVEAVVVHRWIGDKLAFYRLYMDR